MYSGIKYSYLAGGDITPLQVSLERLDNTKPHTPDNVILVCYFANLARSQWNLDVMLPLWK